MSKRLEISQRATMSNRDHTRLPWISHSTNWMASQMFGMVSMLDSFSLRPAHAVSPSSPSTARIRRPKKHSDQNRRRESGERRKGFLGVFRLPSKDAILDRSCTFSGRASQFGGFKSHRVHHCSRKGLQERNRKGFRFDLNLC